MVGAGSHRTQFHAGSIERVGAWEPCHRHGPVMASAPASAWRGCLCAPASGQRHSRQRPHQDVRSGSGRRTTMWWLPTSTGSIPIATQLGSVVIRSSMRLASSSFGPGACRPRPRLPWAGGSLSTLTPLGRSSVADRDGWVAVCPPQPSPLGIRILATISFMSPKPSQIASPPRPLGPAGSHEPVAQSDRGDPDHRAGVGRLDHLAPADVHRDVVAAARAVEEQVPGLEV